MINKFIVLALCLAIGNVSLAQDNKGKIKIIIAGIKNTNGQILISLHNKNEGFPGTKEHSLLNRALEIKGDTVECEFAKLPYGDYAVAIFHDENSDFKMDTNMFGMPKEGIGISNDAYKMMGPPDYDEAKFDLNGDEKVIHINMHYY